MKKIVLRYGSYAGVAELLIFVLTWVVIKLTGAGHVAQGYIGWVNLICPLLFVYFGIRYYRDNVNNGALGFLQAIKIGLLIVIIPALSFALVETVYTLYIEPDFYKNISVYDIEQYKKTLPPAEFAVKLKQIQQQVEANKNPVYNFTCMAFAIASLGIIATLISALVLFRRQKAAVAAG
jgi:hypothetical protein